MHDPIPTIREDEATGEIAALFADLRDTLNVPFVNLIWRHLATMPGMLAWTWGVVKPLHAAPALRQAASLLRAGVQIPAGLRQSPAVFDAAGVAAADRQVIRAMLHDYGAANAANLLSLLLVQATLSGEVSGGGAGEGAPVRPSGAASSSPLPPLPGLADLAPSLRALVLELDQFGRLAPTDAVASLYRHLAHWPGFLAVTHAALSLPHHAGTLRAEHERTRAHADALMREHVLPLAHIARPPPERGRAAAEASIEQFTGQMIARMVAMGEIMLGLLPAETDDAARRPGSPA